MTSPSVPLCTPVIMSISISKHSKNVDALQHLKHGMHTVTVLGNDNADHPMSCGLFTVSQGEPTSWTYPCSEFIYGVEGEIHLQLEDADGKPAGEPYILNAGDIAHVDKGSKARFSSPTSGKAFWVTQLGHQHDIKQFLA